MSALEEELVCQLTAMGAPAWERNYVFAPKRRLELDFAWPAVKLACEINGGTFMVKGGHNTGLGLRRDFSKYNLATILGWKVLLYDSKAVHDGSAALEIIQFLRTL